MYSHMRESHADYERQSYSVEAIKLQKKKQSGLQLKEKVMKDTLTNMIYEIKHRELDTVSKMSAQLGIQGAQASVKGKGASNLLRK